MANTKKNYQVILLEGNYPIEKNSSCTLLRTCHTRDVAQFISSRIKERKKLDFYPTIRETSEDADPESYFIENYLLRMAEQTDNIINPI